MLLNWNVVEKRIRELVQADKYLSPEGKEAYAQYKQERAEETETISEGEAKAPETEKADIEQLNERLSEMSAVVKICGALDRKDVVGWNEETQEVTIADDERTLKGKEVYDFLFSEATDYVMIQTISGETEKALEMDGLLKDAGQYAERYEGEPDIEQTEAPKEQPQIDKSGAVNFHIAPETEESAGKGFAAKEKFRQNVEAIRTLEKIESENRIATPEEQEILAKYVGWGGLADAFDETKANWASEYQELKSLLSAEEYDSARESTLNAHYTSPVIIKAIYDAMERMGFSKGNILEPAMGIGNFFGMLPDVMLQIISTYKALLASNYFYTFYTF